VPTFADRGFHVVSTTDFYGQSLDVYTKAATFPSQQLLNFTHEAEWIPFQTHYFSENLIAPGNEPGLQDL
jgi:hypothetical protein